MVRIHCQARTVARGMKAERPALRRTALVAVLGAIAVLASGANALAVSGTPLKIAEPVRFGPPAVAVDSAGTAYVAWSNETDLKEEGDTIEYCVLPAGTVVCTHTGKLIVEGAKGPFISQVQVIVDESTIVLLAEVYGVGEKYGPVQEWTSIDGGAEFKAVDAGRSVADAVIDADSGPVNALVVPGTDTLGYAFVTASGPPTFDGFPFSSPPECSFAVCAEDEVLPKHKGHKPYATLQTEEEAELHALSNEHGSFASRLGAGSGVLGVYETLGKPGPAECGSGTAYVYGSGEQSATNNYDLSPGEPDSAWKKALTPGDCEADYVAAGGGPSGLGVVEKDLTRGYEVYHRFNQITESFEPSTVTITKEGGLDTSVSQDGSGGIYVTYLGNAEDAIRLAYSSTGGTSWTGPATLNANTDLKANALVSAVGADGKGWAVWKDGESVIAQQLVASDATPPIPPPLPPPPPPPPPPVLAALTIPMQTDDVTSKGDLSVVMDCAGAPCSGSLTLIAKVKKTTGKGKKKKTKIVAETIGTASFSSLALGVDTVVVKLDSKGLSLLKHDGYKLKSTGSATYLSGGVFKTTTGDVALKGHKPKKKKK